MSLVGNNLSGPCRALTSTLLNTFGMNWNANYKPSLLILHQYLTLWRRFFFVLLQHEHCPQIQLHKDMVWWVWFGKNLSGVCKALILTAVNTLGINWNWDWQWSPRYFLFQHDFDLVHKAQRALTSILLNTFWMNWNTSCEPSLLIHH